MDSENCSNVAIVVPFRRIDRPSIVLRFVCFDGVAKHLESSSRFERWAHRRLCIDETVRTVVEQSFESLAVRIEREVEMMIDLCKQRWVAPIQHEQD